MEHLTSLLDAYASDVRRLLHSHSTTEQTYYPAVHDLWTGIVRHLQLQFDVRFGTSEGRPSGADHPDVAFYDKGDFLAVCGEVKLPDEDIEALAATTANNDQIGRYLAQTGVVLLTTVRAFALVACKTAYRRTPGATVAPEHRDVVHTSSCGVRWRRCAAERPCARRPRANCPLSSNAR